MNEELIFDLKRNFSSSNVASRAFYDFTENSFYDVTLVSDDQKPFQAHRYVLSIFSPVLKNILFNNPQSHPLIYLRGVNHQELYSILQFIVKTQRNSTQLNSTQSNSKVTLVGLDTVPTCSPPHHHHPTTTTNFSGTSRPARELKFGTDTH